MAVVEKPFPPGDYDVVVVGSGPGGLQTSYELRALGVRHAVLSADEEPAGMFRRFPVFERLITWTKQDAPFEHGTREYEWYDHNSLLAEEQESRALVPQLMERRYDVPSRQEMEAGLVAFAERTELEIRYGCRWESTRREEDGLVLVTSDGEYRCRAAVFAIGVTEPWMAPIPGIEDARHYVDTGAAEQYRGGRVFIVGKRNSGFEVASGLLAWASEVVLASPRPVETARIGRSPVRTRYLNPLDEYSRGGAGALVVDAAIERIERRGDGFHIAARGTTWPGELMFEADHVLVATGFRTPLLDLPELGLATVSDGRIPALTPFFESVSFPGVYFAGNASQGSPGLRKQGLAGNSTSVNGFRYNARVLARHLAESRFGIRAERPALDRDEVLPYLLAELAHAPELWVQKGYLARVLACNGAIRDEGIVPLEHFVDEGGGDAVAVTVEMDPEGRIYPAAYVRVGGRLVEHALPEHPAHLFSSETHRRELASLLELIPALRR
ncbi:MAG TPA: NAD(P)-binding domain-containing protein [Gaiellaceae bacterium]|jgi:thioredoxin reductase